MEEKVTVSERKSTNRKNFRNFKVYSLLYRFIWNGKTEKVSRNIFMQPIEKGGYNMHDFHHIDKAIKVMWMKNFFKEKTFLWKKYLEIHSGVSNILPVPRSVAPMGNVTKYLQKFRMGVYDNENQPDILRKITRIWGNPVLAHTDWK